MSFAGMMLAFLLAGRQIVEGIVLFWIVPFIVIQFIRPVSRSKVLWCMGVYILVWFLSGVYGAFGHYANFKYMSDDFGRLAVYLLIFRDLAVPPIFGLLGCALLCITRRVDEKIPDEYRHVQPVYATVIGTDDVTRVEYNGHIYVMAKEFPFMFGDVIKVRLIEGKPNCWLA